MMRQSQNDRDVSHDDIADDPYRPQYHFSPPANWMNDPNGLVYYKGEYHLYYQHYPGGISWGPMHWGHAVSGDLVNWRHLPIALYPDDNGLIFSGSVVIDRNDAAGFGREAMIAVFTYHSSGSESQGLAYSLDFGRTWTKYRQNPVLRAEEGISDFRDPRVFRYGDCASGRWIMCLAVGRAIRFFSSTNLREWRSEGALEAGDASEAEPSGGVWETPDLFLLPVDGGPETRWVLTVGVVAGGPAGGSGAGYFVGHFDGRTFTPDAPGDTAKWLDWGPDFYAPQSWNDEPEGRRITVGWLSNWRYAAVTPAATWRGALSLPRELALTRTDQGIRLIQQPIAALQSLRREAAVRRDETIAAGSYPIDVAQGDLLEIEAEFEILPQSNLFGFYVRAGSDRRTIVGYHVGRQSLFVDRTHSGRVDFHPDFAGVYFAPMEPEQGLIRMHIFVDRSMVEVFGNGGLVVLSACIFPSAQTRAPALFAEGGPVRIRTAKITPLKPARFTHDSLQSGNPRI